MSAAGASGEPPRDAASRASITPYRDGPYLIRGDFALVDHDGNPIPVRRKTIALCRCGRSRIAPFCDGTHTLTGFRAESGRAPRHSGEEQPSEGSRPG